MPHRLPSAQWSRGPGKQRPLSRLWAQEQDAEVEQQKAVASRERQLQQGEISTRPQRRQDHEVGAFSWHCGAFRTKRKASWTTPVKTKAHSVLCCCLCSCNRDELQQHQQAEVLYLSLEKGNMVPQIKHNPWSLKCHQQHLQRMKENAKHRNQYSILSGTSLWY